MTITVSRVPQLTTLNSSDWVDQSGFSNPGHDEVADLSDATYIQGVNNGGPYEMGFLTAYTLPANRRCWRADMLIRIRGVGAGSLSLTMYLRPVSQGDGAVNNLNETISSFQLRTSAYTFGLNGELSATSLAQLEAHIRQNAGGATAARVASVEVLLSLNERSYPRITGPTGGGINSVPTVTWTNEFGSETPSAYRIRIDGITVPGTFYDSGRIVGQNTSHSPGVSLTSGHSYQAYIYTATVFDGDGSDYWSIDSVDSVSTFTVDTASAPTVTGPSGTIANTSTPAVTWIHNAGTAQAAYTAKVFSLAQYTAGGFNPETSPFLWSSGDVLSSAMSATIGTALPSGTTMKAYVRTAGSAGLGFGPFAAGPTFTIASGGTDRPGRVFFATTTASPTAGFYEFDDTKRGGRYTWQSAPLRAPDGRQIEVREVQLYVRTYDANAQLAVSVGGVLKTITTPSVGRHQLSFRFRVRAEVLDVTVTSIAGIETTNEAPTVEAVRIGWQPGHLLR